jgi:hypothetical protein
MVPPEIAHLLLADFSRRFSISRLCDFALPAPKENDLLSRRFVTNCSFFQQTLCCFPRDFRASSISRKPRCRFSRRIRGFFSRVLADQNLGGSKNPHYGRRHLFAFEARAAECRFCTSFRGKRFDFVSYRGFARSLRPATSYGFRTLIFCAPNCENFTFLVRRATRTPRWFCRVGFAHQSSDAAN